MFETKCVKGTKRDLAFAGSFLLGSFGARLIGCFCVCGQSSNTPRFSWQIVRKGGDPFVRLLYNKIVFTGEPYNPEKKRSMSTTESAPFPERLQTLCDGLPLPAVQGVASHDLLMDGIKRVLLLPEAVTIAQAENAAERERFIQLTSGDDWSLRVEATERDQERVSLHVPRQSMHVYAFHYGARLLVESTIKAPPQKDGPIDEAWGVWGVQEPLSPDFTKAWKARFFFLVPDSFEMGDESNFRYISTGLDREKIRVGVASLLGSARPDAVLTKASEDYWVDRGYVVIPSDPPPVAPEVEE